MACCSACEAKAKAKPEISMSDKTTSLKSILTAIGVLKDADPNLVKALSDDATVDATLAKGDIDSKRSEDLGRGAEYVKDNWSRGNTNKTATREEIKMGPGEESSGAGAERMVRHYSNPAEQHHGIEQAVERLAAMFDGFGKSMTDAVAAIKADSAATKALVVQLAIAKSESEDEEEEDEEESEVVEINASRGKSRVEQAKILMKSLKKAKTDEAKAAIKAELTKLLAKAQINFLVTKSKTDRAALYELAAKAGITKADINVVQEEEEDEEDEEEGKGKSHAVAETSTTTATKAVTDDKGNQADREDNKNGNQAAAAKATDASAGNVDMSSIKSQLEAALAGQAVLSTSIKGLMDIVSGKSRVSDQIPELAKAKPDVIQAILDTIDQQETAGSLAQADAMAARDIASQTRLVADGKLDGAIVKARLEKSSNTVRAIFTNGMAEKAA
jgi:hypothetical protein